MSFLSISFITFFIIVLTNRTLLGSLAPSPPSPTPGGKPLVLCHLGVRLLACPGHADGHLLLLRVRIEDSSEPTARRRWLTVGIGLNLLLLTYY